MNEAGRVANKRARRGAGRDKRGLNVEFDGALVDESGGEGAEKLGDPESVPHAGQVALRIISAGFLVSTLSVTASGSLEALGKGTQSLVISLCRYIIIMIPAAWILCRLFGPVGV